MSRLNSVAMILTESLGVGGIVDGEAGLESDGLAVAPQNAHAGGVEGGDPHALGHGPISEPSLSRISAAALLVKVMARIWLGHAPNWLKIQAMRAGQHAGFAGACTGSDQQRLTAVLHGFRLLRVQVAHEFLCAACDDFRLVVHCCLPLNRDIHVYHMHGSAQDNVHLRVSISFTDIQQWEVQCRNLRSESKARER